jgi:predicted Zn-dependent peptidase
VSTYRSAAEIGRTEQGPRELPSLAQQRGVDDLAVVDTVLPNGLRVLAVRRVTVPMVEMRMRIPFAGTDSLHPATSELLAETVLTGTARRDRVAMDTDLALIGGELGTNVDPERLIISGGALAHGLDRLLDVLGDALTGASYVAPEVDSERARLSEQLAVAWSQPSVIARDALQRHRYGDHPYAREVPKVEDLAQVSAADVRALHGKSVLPRGSTLVLVGDIDPERAVDQVSAALAGWQSSDSAAELPRLPELLGGDAALVHRPGAVQSQIRLSAQAIDRTDSRYAALQLANLAFGGYFSSRLVENIREDKGYTYGAVSRFEFSPGAATLGVDADTASEVTAAALMETRYELSKMAVQPPTPQEVESVRQYAIGSTLIATSSQAGLASQLAALAAVGLDANWLTEHPSRLAAVTVEEVAAAAREFFAPARFSGVVVGDADLLGDALGALGGVVVA